MILAGLNYRKGGASGGGGEMNTYTCKSSSCIAQSVQLFFMHQCLRDKWDRIQTSFGYLQGGRK